MNLGRKSLTLVLGVACAAALFAGCGDDAAKNEPKDGGAQGVAVKKIADIDLSQAKDGTMKGEDYGKKNGQISDAQNYKKAQNAVKANAAYGAQLVERQQPGKVDAISGATISYEQFIEASTKALDEAKKQP